MTFGKRLQQERDRLNMGQADMAVAGGVGRTSQHLYENDVRLPDVNYLLGLHRAGVDLLHLLLGNERQHDAQCLSFHPATLTNIYRLVDEYCVDARKRPLPLDERMRFFLLLCVTHAGQRDEVNLDGIRAQLARSTGT